MRREKDGCGSTEILAGIFLSWVMEPAKKADECRPFLSNCKAVGLSGSFSLLLCDLAFEQAGALRKFLIVGFDEEGIEATAMFDRTQGVGGNAQAIALAERFGDQRNIAEVRQETATRPVVRVADIVAVLDRLAGQFTSAGHFGLTFNCVLFRPRPECPNSSIQSNLLLLARDLGQAAYWESRVSIVTAAATVK